MMKTSYVLILLVMAAACGPREPGLAPRAPVERVVSITTPGGTHAGDIRMTQEDRLVREQVAASADAVLAVLPDVLTGLGLPAPEIDTARRLAVVQPYTVSRRIGNIRMSQLLDCGRGPAGPYADSYRIKLSVITQVTPDGESSTLLTRINATGQNTGGTSGNATCTSQGQLENAITKAVHEAVG